MNHQRLHPECIRCLIQKQLDACPPDAPPELQLTYMQRFLALVANARWDVGVPVVSRDINNLKQELFGQKEDFTQIKHRFNALMLAQEDRLQQQVDEAPDSLLRALQYAYAGNYIDFGGALYQVEEATLSRILDDAPAFAPDAETFEALRTELLRAERILYLTDNCGEIVLDKLLLRVIRRMNPKAQLIAMVRGRDVLNDATREDAEQVGLAQVAQVMDNGSGVAGTWLEDLSAEARGALESADLILAKGQANFETLRGCGLNVYYLFMCKCDWFAKRFQVPRFTGMLIHDSQS